MNRKLIMLLVPVLALLMLAVSPTRTDQAASNAVSTNITTRVAPFPGYAPSLLTTHQQRHLADQNIVGQEARLAAKRSQTKTFWIVGLVVLMVFGLAVDLIQILRKKN
ncbi:hypothetical protein [Lapidilactobacillus wuchangensis]|uniref:hypothetical protein n=1 Tax=Lapidilactobacillus wuchangensis TaxID=2486001 RepID=UPI000F79CC2C|nr:hypothetical protein [Lapidilactobacillus wuchangensis]